MKKVNVRIVTRKNAHWGRVPLKWYERLIIQFSAMKGDKRIIYQTPLTPWKIFAMFFVKRSQYYKF